MAKMFLITFLILFAGRIILRYILQQLNINHLKTHGKTIPPVFAGEIDEATLSKMVDYTYDSSKIAWKENLFEDIVELAILFLLVPLMVDRLIEFDIHIILQALIFFGILAAVTGLAGLPFDIYGTFVLEKRYGFSTITWKIWITDLIKSLIISTILMAIMITVFMTFVYYLSESWWFWAWVFFTVFEVVLLWLYPILIAPLFNKYEPIHDKPLEEKIVTLMHRAGLKAKGIYQVDAGKRSRHTNAYFTGIGKTKRIVLYDTLLASHSHEEIVAVLAHEVGHWKKKHILKQLVFTTGVSLGLFYFVYLAAGSHALYNAFGIHHTPIYAGLFLVSLYLGALRFFLSPIGAAIIRRYEREADGMVFGLTGTTQPMIDALKRLAKDNLANLHPHPLYAWFYYSHPPLVERIEYLWKMEQRKDGSA